MATVEQRNQEATVYVGNIDDKATDELIWELFTQCGPVVNVHLPKDKITGLHQNYGFVEFKHEHDSEYAAKIMNMVKLYGKPIRVNKATQDRKGMDIGANIFVGNLDPSIDEKLLHDTFSAFGGITRNPKIMVDPETGLSKGYAFISFDSFEASDLAIQCMNGQFLCNRPIVVEYAFKKDTPGERHGSQAERLLAAEIRAKNPALRPNTMFATSANKTPQPRSPPPPPHSLATHSQHMPSNVVQQQPGPPPQYIRPQFPTPPPHILHQQMPMYPHPQHYQQGQQMPGFLPPPRMQMRPPPPPPHLRR